MWWPPGQDPTVEWRDGPALWTWLYEVRSLLERPALTVRSLQLHDVNVVLDTRLPHLTDLWPVSRLAVARRRDVPCVTVEAQDGGGIADAVVREQPRSGLGPRVPLGSGRPPRG